MTHIYNERVNPQELDGFRPERVLFPLAAAIFPFSCVTALLPCQEKIRSSHRKPTVFHTDVSGWKLDNL
jgi:hypothetical protein